MGTSLRHRHCLGIGEDLIPISWTNDEFSLLDILNWGVWYNIDDGDDML
jgi:hypothetical protein